LIVLECRLQDDGDDGADGLQNFDLDDGDDGCDRGSIIIGF
jgi:hypothetical protein